MATDEQRNGAADGTSPAQLIRREGEYWTIVFDGVTCRLRDVRGLQHLAFLLTHPHEEIPALMLERCLDQVDAAQATRAGPHDARERARVNVTRALSAALTRIRAHHPALGEHLKATIRTGMFCAYRPDPRLPVRWTG